MPIASVWAWLGKPRNRSVLAFLGAGLAAVVAGAWQVYLHMTPQPAAAPPSVVIQMQPAQAQASTAPAPDVGAAKDLQASQARTLKAETSALDSISQQIENANAQPAAKSH
jgi:hypothetical protein